MLKDITLGQYFPGKTVVHRLDPRTKLLMTVLYIVALFVAQGWIAYGIVFAFLVMSIALSRIRPKAVLRGLKPVVIVVIFTAVLNLFYTGGEHVLVRFWGLTITWEGIQAALFMGTRIIMLITGTFLLTYTTSPIALTDGLESLLNPLKKIRLPVHELTMIMCIALRFIPTLIEETDKIMSAARILSPAICCSGRKPWCRSWFLCSSARSAGPTSWLLPWNAGVTRGATAGPN